MNARAIEENRIGAATGPMRGQWSVVILKNRVLGVLLFEALVIIVFSLVAGKFFTLSNLNTIFLNACIMAILASAEAVVIITRNYDVSIASILALSAYVGFDIIKRFPEAGPILVLVPIAIGLICGLLNGLLVAYGRVSSIFVTLGGLSIYRGIATVYAKGQQIEPKDIPAWVSHSVTGNLLPGISNLALIAIAVVALVSIYLRYTRIGRQIYAIGRTRRGDVLRAQGAAGHPGRLRPLRRPGRAVGVPLRRAVFLRGALVRPGTGDQRHRRGGGGRGERPRGLGKRRRGILRRPGAGHAGQRPDPGEGGRGGAPAHLRFRHRRRLRPGRVGGATGGRAC